MGDIYCFGDSITAGAWDSQGGWVSRLHQFFNQQKIDNPDNYGREVYNLGVAGDLSADVARRIEPEIMARRKAWSSPRDLFIIQVGLNDSRISLPSKEPFCEPEEYHQNLDIITKLIQAHTNNILFVGLTPVIDKLTYMEDGYAEDKRVSIFNSNLLDFCNSRQIGFVETYEPFKSIPNNSEMYFKDGVHLNDSGHSWLFQQIKPKAVNILGSAR